MNELTLYVDSNFDSPWAMSAFVALEEKGLPYTLETVTLSKKETFGPAYGARTRRVPSLRKGSFWLAESTAIEEYLAETYPFPKYPRLFPENLEERAVCRELQAWLRSDLAAIRQERPTTTIWFERAKAPLSGAAQDAVGRLLEGIDPLITEGRATIFQAWCIADTDLALMLQRLNLNGTPLPAKVKAFAEAQWRRPSVAKWNALPRGPAPR